MVIALSQLPQHRGKKRCRDEAERLRKEAETPQTCPKCSLDMSAQNHSNRARHIASCQPCGSRKRPASNSLTGHRRPDAPVAMRSMTSFFAPRAPTTTATTSEATTTTTTTAAAEATGTTAEATPPSARAPEFPLGGVDAVTYLAPAEATTTTAEATTTTAEATTPTPTIPAHSTTGALALEALTYLAPVHVACPTVMEVDMGSGHVPAIAYCSGFVPPDSVGGDDWMSRFPFLKFQEDGLPFVINGLRWHSHNCARQNFVTDAASGVNDECENLNTKGRPAYNIIQRFVATSPDHRRELTTGRVSPAQCDQERRCAR